MFKHGKITMGHTWFQLYDANISFFLTFMYTLWFEKVEINLPNSVKTNVQHTLLQSALIVGPLSDTVSYIPWHTDVLLGILWAELVEPSTTIVIHAFQMKLNMICKS